MRQTFLSFTCCAIACILAGCNSKERFDDNFKDFVKREVDAPAIQAWHSKQKPAPGILVVAPADWPAEIARLKPERVELWHDRGVVLTWGRVGHSGDRRQVFIADAPATLPPDEVLWNDGPLGKDTWVPIKDHSPADWTVSKPSVWYWIIVTA